MTKDLAIQGSCIAKIISIHSYPRDLNKLGKVEKKEKKRNKIAVKYLINCLGFFKFSCISVLTFRGAFHPKALNLDIFRFWGA